jgi:hypothetical protein
MKKYYCIRMLLVTLVAILTACSHEESTITDKLQQYVSNDVDFVFAGDMHQMLEVTDSKADSNGKVKPSDYMQKLIAALPSAYRNDVNDLLDAEGFDWSNAVLAVNISENGNVQTLGIFSVKDTGDFSDFFVDKYNFKKGKQDGFVTLAGPDLSILVRDDLAFIASNNGKELSVDESIRVVNDWQASAKDKAFADWKCKYLDNGDVLSAMFSLSDVCQIAQDRIDEADFWEQTRPQTIMLGNMLPVARKLIVGATFTIKDRTATLNGKFFTQDGKTFNIEGLDGSFNSSLLKYATDNDVAALGIANAKIITQMIGHSITGFGGDIVTKWLNNFEGSMMLAAGVNTDDMAKIAEAPTNNMHLVLAIDCKAGKAGQALNSFAGLLEFSGDATVTKHVSGDELRFKMVTSYRENPNLEPWEDGYNIPVYTNFVMKADGDVLLLSNTEIDPTPVTAFTPDMFKGKFAVAVLNLPADSNLMKAVRGSFGADVRFSLDKSQFEAKITLTNSKKSFVEVLVDIMQNA